MELIAELRRRKVFRVAAAYAVAAWALAQVADLVLENTAAPPWVMQVILLVLALGFPIAVILAWAFEVTSDGVRRTEAIAPGERAPKIGGQDALLIVLLVAVIGVAGFQFAGMHGSDASRPLETPSAADAAAAGDSSTQTSGQTSPERTSIAVLPFRAMSSGEDDEYFADGLTEEILNALAQLPELLVTARTSSFHFKDKDLPVPQIAETLGVGHVLEGSVRRGGGTVRITAQLIRAEDGFHLWSETYDRSLEDIFAVQEDIAANVADVLNVVLDADKLLRMRQSGTDDLDAFIAFQKARKIFIAAHEDVANIERKLAPATPLFDEALAASPGWVAAVLYKADADAHTVFASASGEREEAYAGEAEAALQTLRADLDRAWADARPGNQRDMLDVERTIFRDDWTGLAAKLDRAVRPGDCPLLNWTFEFAVTLGDAEATREKALEILRCDPLNTLSIVYASRAEMWAGDANAAIEITKDAIGRGVEFAWVDDFEFWARLSTAELDHPAVRDSSGPIGWFLFPRELVTAAAAGDLETARPLAEDFFTSEPANDQSSMIVAAMIGDRDRANAFAARIDARPGGSLALNNALYSCLCGVPFDLAATPNFARRLQQADVRWPPETIIDFPAKDW